MLKVNSNLLIRAEPAQHYLFSILLLLAACLTEWVLRDILPGATFLFLFPTILVCSLLFGGLPGLTVMALGFVFSWIFLMAPYYSLDFSQGTDAMRLVTFAVIGLLVAWVGSRLRQAEKDRQEIRRVTAAETEAKSRYLANMSHEIRTPLGTILGFSELLMDGNVSGDERTQYSDTIRRNAHRLASLMDDIFHLAEIEARKIQVDRSTLNPELILDAAIDSAKKRVDGHHSQVLRKGKDSLPKNVYGDAARIKQMLTSLFDSMSGFAKNGEIYVEASVARTEESTAWVKFTVSGTTAVSNVASETLPANVLITADQERQLFAPFTEDFGVSDRPAGIGLGFMLAHQIARALGGDVHVEHNPAKFGSAFVALLPLGLVTETSKPEFASSGVDFSGKRILVVEDNPDNSVLVERILNKTGAKLGFAESGIQALERMSSDQYDLILMDIQMPQMDGYEATRQLRSQGYRLPIIALTANALKEDRDRCLAAGCDDYLTKPIQTQLLLGTIAVHLNPQ